MLRLLKNEIKYNSIIQLSLMVVLVYLVLNFIFEQNKGVGVIIIIFSSILLFSFIKTRIEERTDRQNILLPLSTMEIGLSRSLLVLLPWILIIPGMYISHYILHPSNLDSVLTVLGQLGFVIAAIGAFLFIHDFYKKNKGNTKWIMIRDTLIATLFVLVSQVLIIYLANQYDSNFSHGKGVILIYAWGIIITFASAFSFVKRKTYF